MSEFASGGIVPRRDPCPEGGPCSCPTENCLYDRRTWGCEYLIFPTSSRNQRYRELLERLNRDAQ